MDGNDVMRAGFYGAWILVSVTCVVSFCLVLYWTTRGDHPLMLSLHTPFRPNWKQKILLGGAAFFILVALYRGGTAFFAWIPSSWGTIDEDGDFRTYQEITGGAIGSICGLVLLGYLNQGLARAMMLKVAAAEIDWLQRINDESSIARLKTMLEEVAEKSADLGKTRPRAGRDWVDEPVSEESLFMGLYARLAERLRKRIAQLEHDRRAKT